MTPLERALRERIRAEGPISVELFMEACNAFYYATRDPLGTGGDFTTAPEISQMFGEMIGAALADWWKSVGAPSDAIYAELGPGRGTLAGDALRVLRFAGFGGDAHFVETSPVLRERQLESVPGARFHEAVGELPDRPLLLVANEFLDALPVRQFVDGRERHVILSGDSLEFDLEGETAEDSPARDEAVGAIATHVASTTGVAIIIDYGHVGEGVGDTLQAVRQHRFVPLLENFGEQDLTAHVDFEAVARVARSNGALATRVVSQGAWLTRLGIEARAAKLGQANPQRSGDISDALKRLTSGPEMGELFKVIALHSPGTPSPAGLS